MKTLIKVCGMRDARNIQEVLALEPDFLGLIFYPKSPRYVPEEMSGAMNFSFGKTKKIGVFVNYAEEQILRIVKLFHLDGVQLHGNESSKLCRSLKNNGLLVLKAFGISSEEDLKKCEEYQNACDFLLFDTKTKCYGGTGRKFDWEVLTFYQGELPFLLSGGLSEEDADQVKAFNHPKMVGVDLNSRFEISPALKDVDRLKTMFQLIRQDYN